MAHCRPVIGARVGGIPSMIIDGETGLLVAPKAARELADALARLLPGVELQHKFALAGRRRCQEKFSQSAHVDAIVDQYRQVVEEHARVTA
jgi:glycosyltransferase involved in cell wall biosynthesis